MTKIQLEFSCTIKDGQCPHIDGVCICDNEEEKPFICEWLQATRKKEKASQKTEVKQLG